MTDLLTPSDLVSHSAESPPPPDGDPAERRTFRASTLDEAVAEARAELGDEVELIEAHRVRRGGLGGFFATDLGVEIVAVSRSETTRSAGAAATDDHGGAITGINRLIAHADASDEGVALERRSGPAGEVGGESRRELHPFEDQLLAAEDELVADADGRVADAAPTGPTKDGPAPFPAPDIAALTAVREIARDSAGQIARSEIADGEPGGPIGSDDITQELLRPSGAASTPLVGPSALIETDSMAGFGESRGTAPESPARDETPRDEMVEMVEIVELSNAAGAGMIDEIVELSNAAGAGVIDEIVELSNATGAGVIDEASGERFVESAPASPANVELAPPSGLLASTCDIGPLEELDLLLRDVGIDLSTVRADGVPLPTRRPAPIRLDDIAALASAQLVQNVTALAHRAPQIAALSVSVTTHDGTTICVATQLDGRDG